jgi:hypothetical protein
MPAGSKTISVVGNYITIIDNDTETLDLNIPKNYVYYTIENIEGYFSSKLFFHILGGFGGDTKVGGFDIIFPDGSNVFNYQISGLITFLRNNTAGPTIV